MDAGQNIKRGAGDGAPREKKLVCRGEHEQNVNGPGLSLGPYQASKRRQESRQSSAAQDPSAPACETDDPSSRTIHHSLRHSDNGPCAISRWSIPPPRDRPFGRKSHREAQHQAPNRGPLPANHSRLHRGVIQEFSVNCSEYSTFVVPIRLKQCEYIGTSLSILSQCSDLSPLEFCEA